MPQQWLAAPKNEVLAMNPSIKTPPDVYGSPRSSNKRAASTALLVLISCNLVLFLSKLRPTSPTPCNTLLQQKSSHAWKLEPMSFILSRLTAFLMAYLSTTPYTGDRLSLSELLTRIRRTWRRPAITLLHIELLATASYSLLLTLAAFARATRGVALETLLVLGSLALLSIVGPVLFAHSDTTCNLGIVASIVEEGCEGLGALERAGQLIKDRKLQAFVLGSVLMLLEQAPFMAFGYHGWMVGDLVVLLLHMIIKFLGYVVYTGFYYECKRKIKI